MSAKAAKAEAAPAARAVPPRPTGPSAGARAVGRHGPAADGRPGGDAPPAVLFLDEPTAGLDPQSRIALWEILGELHTDGQTILLTTHYMEEADQLCDRRRHHRPRARCSPSTRPPTLKASTGIDTDGHHHGRGDLDALADAAARRGIAGAHRRRRCRRRGRARVKGGQGRAARGRRTSPSRPGSPSPTSPSTSRRSRPCSSSSPGRTSANDAPTRRAHRPRTASRERGHRRLAGRRLPRAAAPRLLRAAQEPQGVHPPHRPAAAAAGLRVHLRLPQDRPGHRRRRAGAAEFSTMLVAGVLGQRHPLPGHPGRRAADGAGVRLHARDRGPRARPAAGRAGGLREGRRPARSSASSPRSSCSRSPSSSRPRRCTSLSTGRCCSPSRRWPASRRRRSACSSARVFDPRTVPLLFGIIVVPLTFLGCIYFPWQASTPSPGSRSLVLVNPLVYMSEGFRAALTQGPHVPLGRLPGDDRLHRPVPVAGLAGFSKRVLA